MVVDAPDARLPGEDRIDFLVRMRNKALEPLFDDAEGCVEDWGLGGVGGFGCGWWIDDWGFEGVEMDGWGEGVW